MSSNEKMNAIVLEWTGDVSCLKFQDFEIPKVGKNEVLIQVKAISVNPVNYQTIREGRLH